MPNLFSMLFANAPVTPPAPIDDQSTQLPQAPGTQPAAPIDDQSTQASVADQQRIGMQRRMMSQMLMNMGRGAGMPPQLQFSPVGFAFPQGGR